MHKRQQQQQYGYLNQDHDYGTDSDDALSSTGNTPDDYRIELDGDASPLKQNKHYNVQYPNDPKNTRHNIAIRPFPFNDNDDTPPSKPHLKHIHETKDDSHHEAVSDTDSCPSRHDKVIEIQSKGTPQRASKYTIHRYDALLNKFLQYKNMLLKHYLFPIKKNFMIFKFKKKDDRKSFPIYIDKQYHTIHWLCIILMTVQIICLYYMHVKHNIPDTSQPVHRLLVLDANDYVMLVFVLLLVVLWFFAVIPCRACHPIFSEQSTTAFTLSIGIVVLYLIIIYTITANLTTDRFLIYFMFTLTFNTCMGYLKFMQYMILSLIIMVEFMLCAALRWQHIITIDLQDSCDPSLQITGMVTTSQFCFGSVMVLLTCLYNGYHVYQTQQHLSYEYLQTSQIYQYAKTNHFSNELEAILDSDKDKHGNTMMEPYKYTDIHEEEQSSVHMHNIKVMNGYEHKSNRKRNDTYSEEDISILSSLHMQHKIDQAVAEQQSSDFTSDDIDVKSPFNLNESIRYSLSTTNPHHMHTLAPQQPQELEMESIQFMEQEASPQIVPSEQLDNEPITFLSLIAHCKYLAEKAGQAVTEIYHVMDGYDHLPYNETRSFADIDQHWIKNKQKQHAAQNAYQRGRSSKKKKRQMDTDVDAGSESPFKERLPFFIKNSQLFEYTPENAAASLSCSIIETSLRLHFADAMERVKYPNKVNRIELSENANVLPPSVPIDDIIRGQTKLTTENGKNVQRELMKNHADKVEYFRNIVQNELIIWIEPLEGAESMNKKDKESQRSVTILIGIADVCTKKAIAGIIHRPFTNETVVGIPNLGVYTYNFSVNPLYSSKHESKRVVVAKYSEIVKDYLQKCCPQSRRDGLTIEGGIGNNVLLLMENECDVFLHPDHENTHKYHICAIEAVIQSLGGDFTQIDGKHYEYSDLTTKLKKGFVATLYGQEYHQQFQYKQYFG